MKKNELVHIHALLTSVAEDFAERGILTREECAEYEALEVTPMSLRARRADHERAVATLAQALADAARRDAEGADDAETEQTVSSR
jgi:hypothetical protein